MSSFVVDRCEGLEGLHQLAAAWETLAGRLARPHFNQMPAWYEAYFHAVQPGGSQVQFFTVHRGRELVAVAPVMRDRRSGWVRRATLANDRGIYTADLVIAPDESPGAVWQALERAARRDRRVAWDVFQAGHGGTMEFSCMRAVASELGYRAIERTARDGYMVIDLAPHDEIIAGLKSKFRNSLKRSQRRLEALGDVRFRWCHEPAEVLPAFDAFVALEKAGWKGSRAVPKDGYPRPAAIGLEQWKYDFYRELLQRFALAGGVNLLLLEAPQGPIGGQISLQLGPTNFLLKTTMDESVRGIAVGHVMIDALLQLLDQGGTVDQINLLTDYAWHEPWSPRRLPYVDSWVYNRTPLGVLALLRQRARR